MNTRPPRRARPESREVQELRRLHGRHPELASAIDLQIELVIQLRRLQARIPTTALDPGGAVALERLQAGHRLVELADLPLDWSDVRLVFRQTVEALERFEAIETADAEQLMRLVREAYALEGIVEQCYGSSTTTLRADGASLPEITGEVVNLALRPYLSRSAELLVPRLDLGRWHRPFCPVCGAPPEFAEVDEGERRLVCGRCTAIWPWHDLACPFCENDTPGTIQTFTSHDGWYRVFGCRACGRYLKALDVRRAGRPVLALVDPIATLPLDAAAVQRGYA